jgi:hypothetical protein
VIVLLLFLALTAQTSSTKLPPAQALPPPSAEEQLVLAPVNRLLAAVVSGDQRALLAEVRPEGGATAAFDLPGRHRVSRESWAEFATTIGGGPNVIANRLLDPAVEIDGDIAMVWSPYVFTSNGQVQHCGVDHFDLVRENGTWKVLNATWSERNTDCPTQ